tara:strand:- start:795 stop:1244 length:450 start_codon:yes stop_codon:yes gene_type:complete
MSFRNFKFNWILNEELAIGTVPQKQKDLKKLSEEGIKSILSLCGENESKSDLDLEKFFHHKRFVLPDHKKVEIVSSIELNESLSIIRDLIKYGPVFVHCFAAIERSPLVCMAWLMKEHQLTLQQSLDYLMQTNPGTNPLPVQLKALKEI